MENPTENTGFKSKSKKYPYVGLNKALDRAKELKDQEGYNSVGVDVAKEHWGYSNTSSSGNRTLSALIQFGLLEEHGKGETKAVRLSNLAMCIFDNPDANERLDALERASSNPPLYSDIISRYGRELPSEKQLAWELKGSGDPSKGALAESAVDIFMEGFLETMKLIGYLNSDQSEAQLTTTDQEVETNTSVPDEGSHLTALPPAKTADIGVFVLPIPLGSGISAEVRMPKPMTEQQWRKFTSVIGEVSGLKSFLVDDDFLPED